MIQIYETRTGDRLNEIINYSKWNKLDTENGVDAQGNTNICDTIQINEDDTTISVLQCDVNGTPTDLLDIQGLTGKSFAAGTVIKFQLPYTNIVASVPVWMNFQTVYQF